MTSTSHQRGHYIEPGGLPHQLSLFDPVLCQRWRRGAHRWRPVHEGGFDAHRYRLIPIAEASARQFVTDHHYSRTFPAARASLGLLDGPRLVGVAVLGVPMHPAVLTKPFPTLDPGAAAELSRLVLLDEVPANAESWLLGRLFRWAAEQGLRGLVAFSDPQPRPQGAAILMPGHVGHVYQVTGAHYLGRATPRTLTLLPDATVLCARAAQKVRAGERGAGGVRARLVALGATPPDPDVMAGQPGAAAQWLRQALVAVGARPLRHRGNHRFAWPVGDRGWRRRCPIGLPELPYPRSIDPVPAR
jgi:hypothetical protein